MPVNKDALIRYRVINRRLKNKYKAPPKLNDLIEECSEALGKPISTRSIQADLQAMRYDSDLGFNAPIVYDAKQGGYMYEDESYSIDNIPLNEDDLDTLEFATRVLEQFKNVDMLKPFAGIIEKIASSYKISRHADLNEQIEFIEFESSPQAKGTEFINPLLNAIKGQKEINLEYQSFREEKSKTYKLHPYLLKEYKNRWYLVAWNPQKEMINTFGLDRIKELQEIDTYFEFIKGFNSRDYFNDAFGITAPQKLNVKKVVLWFSPDQAKYILTQPIHHSQKIIADDKKGLTVELKVMISYELKSQILSYGSGVKVLKPKGLAAEIADEIKKMKKNY
jgi:predicted DNA-binding transcriptional regulator YafY